MDIRENPATCWWWEKTNGETRARVQVVSGPTIPVSQSEMKKVVSLVKSDTSGREADQVYFGLEEAYQSIGSAGGPKFQSGVIERYARHQRRLSNGQQLTGLPPALLAAVIQDWIADTGVGVDCSGFVLQAAIRARDAVRRESGRRGVPAPPEVDHKERYAVAFCEGPAVRSAGELRPGDAWVLGTEHVRIVSSVLRVGGQLQFSSAESSGTSTSPTPGLVSRTWLTRDLERLHPIALAAGPATAASGGSFHRIPQ